MTPKKPKELHLPSGRPSAYKEEFNEQAYKLALLGATDVQMADFFDVEERTINRWKIDYPKFCQSLKDGKLNADTVIANALFHRAKGYRIKEEKTIATGEIVELERELPSDVTAQIFWLKNRQPKLWRDKQPDETADNITLAVAKLLGNSLNASD